MARAPCWERAKRYQRLMQEGGHFSIRALAEALGEDFSKIARSMQLLELPEPVFAALRRHADNPNVRARFTEKELRRMVTWRQAEILGTIERAALPRRPPTVGL